MGRYSKAITAAVSLLVAFALYGPEKGAELYNEVEIAISAIVTALVFTIPNRPGGPTT